MSGPIFDPNAPGKAFFSDENFAALEQAENQVFIDGEGNEVRPVTTAQYADWAPGPNESAVTADNVRGRPQGDHSTLTFGDEVL